MATHAHSRLFRFGLYEADLENARLLRKGVRVRLQEQPFRILAMLLECSGQIVTRDELRQKLWPAGTYVDFDGSLNAALKRLRAALDDDAENPRFIETVPKRGYRFIAPVATETTSAAAEVESLAPVGPRAVEIPAAETRSPALSQFPVRRGLWPVAALVAILAVATFFVFRRRASVLVPSPSEANVDIAQTRHSVAVLGFENASGRPSDAWLSTALTEMLRTELGAGGKLRVVPGENVAQFRLTSPWSETDSLSQPTASRIGNALSSELLVLGSFAAVGEPQSGTVRVDFRLQDAQTGELLYEGAETGSQSQFFGLVAKIGADLRERLNLPMISESEEVSVVSSLPSDADANRFYSLGLAKLHDADVTAAKDLFLQAEKLDPRFPLVHLMLSRAWGGLGYDEKAKDEIKIAYQLSSGLPETDKLQIEGAYFGSLRDSDKSISSYRALCALYPDSVDYGEQLIVALNAAGRREEAVGVINQLRALAAPASEDPRLDFWQAQIMSYSEASAVQPLFGKAAAEAKSRGQTLLYARFRLSQCTNQVYGDHPQGAIPHCQEAYDIYMAAGNHLYAADALRTMGDSRGGMGDIKGARELYKQALSLLTPLGEHEKTGVVLNNMAIGYENQGQVAQAEKLFRQAAETWTECGDLEHAGAALGNLGDVLMLRGQLHQAELQYERARKQIEVTSPNGITYLLYSIANLHLYEGDITQANRLALQALEIARRMNNSNDIASDIEVIGTIQISAGDLAAARTSFQQALSIYQQKGNKDSIAEAEAALAGVSLEEGNLSDAEQQLRKSLVQFRAQNLVLDQAQAETDLARVLLREGKLAEARQTISDATALSSSSRYPYLILPAKLQDARIEAAELSRGKGKADFAEPRRKLLDALSSARKLGYYQIACETRLALAELEIRSNPGAAREHLAELAAEANQRGLKLISRQAASLKDAPPSGHTNHS